MPLSKTHIASSIARHIKAARGLHREGRLEEALKSYQGVLDMQPDNADALYLSGLVLYRQKHRVKAVERIQQALIKDPNHGLAQGSMGQIYQDAGDNSRAVSCFIRASQLSPENPDVLNGLGLSLASLGKIKPALDAFSRAISLNPTKAETYNNLANLQTAQGSIDEAEKNYRRSLALRPGFAEAWNNLGVLYQQKQQPGRAIEYFEAAINHKQDYAQALNNLGASLIEQKQAEKALTYFRQAIKIIPDFPEAVTNLGMALQGLGRHTQARKVLDQAIKISPVNVTARWARCMAELEFVYGSKKEMDSARERYETRLDELIYSVDLDDPVQRAQAISAVGVMQPFLLPYQAQDDRRLQLKYGEFISQIMKTERPVNSVSSHKPENIRVGIVSAFFYDHSNWKIPIEGWLQHLVDTYDVYAYYTGVRDDAYTDRARALCSHFRSGLSVFQFAEVIVADKPDVLIYPEVGMHPVTMRLAVQRLVAVQCTSWGHPVTSGLETMDYFLSSELMEPANAGVCYSEKLVRLAGLSFTWSAPVFKQTSVLSRDRYALADKDIVYLCVQNLSKYLPQHDYMLVEISRQVLRSKMVFIESDEFVTERLKLRLSACFAAAGLSFDDRVRFIPRRGREDYHALNRMADAFRDTPEWSGCNSTLEALHCDLPVVTMRGALMRGRHSSAIYERMQYRTLTAKDEAQYIALAVRLGKDRAWRAQQRECIARSKDRLIDDLEPAKSLAALIPRLVAKQA